MIKNSNSIYKIPFYNISTLQLDSVNKIKDDYQDVMCVCAPGEPCFGENRPIQGGYKYQFQYSIQPTMEPISYKLKGYKWNASLTYNNIGVDVDIPIMEEVVNYINFINNTYLIGCGDSNSKFEPIVTNITDNVQNKFENQKLENKVFQKMKRTDQIGEMYSPFYNLKKVCMSLSISSGIYIVDANCSIIDQHRLGV